MVFVDSLEPVLTIFKQRFRKFHGDPVQVHNGAAEEEKLDFVTKSLDIFKDNEKS